MTQKVRSAFWDHFERWRPLMREGYDLNWLGEWLENDWCKDCRYCCGPQGADEPFPMALLPRQVGPDNTRDFYMLDRDTAGIGPEGCKSDTPMGCRLSQRAKPIACGLFPIVLVDGGLFLYQTCPAALMVPLAKFVDLAIRVGEWLMNFPESELRHISIHLPCETLMVKYIYLHVRLFDEHGTGLKLD